ncbi:enoyl-CoA delta isomerase 1, mitochondrial-like [Neocloeon triangulifer]|uniref:enoyl-CoA delta isomerase 1, mitochondrial-like n=1 Tax=Neocloeon triangulifer TaxID=2078957 RepID=UPI00286F85AC|nr:enoyl-CoA delta isomerase 1, mitochondrial-like [Neocloeon triangulifer]
MLNNVRTFKGVKTLKSLLMQKRGVSLSNFKPNKLVELSFNDKTGIATVSMNRPPVNAFDRGHFLALQETLQKLEDNKECRGMILASSRDNIFSAGLDVAEFNFDDLERVAAFWTLFQDIWLKLFTTSYPTVAAINGYCPAGSCVMSLACEYRVMVADPRFRIGLNEVHLGIVAPKWALLATRDTVSYRPAELALTTGKMFSPEEAQTLGLVDELAKDKVDALSKAEKFLVENFSSVNPIARKLTKLSLREPTTNWLMKNKKWDLDFFMDHFSKPDVQENLRNYMENLKNKKK